MAIYCYYSRSQQLTTDSILLLPRWVDLRCPSCQELCTQLTICYLGYSIYKELVGLLLLLILLRGHLCLPFSTDLVALFNSFKSAFPVRFCSTQGEGAVSPYCVKEQSIPHIWLSNEPVSLWMACISIRG